MASVASTSAGGAPCSEPAPPPHIVPTLALGNNGAPAGLLVCAEASDSAALLTDAMGQMANALESAAAQLSSGFLPSAERPRGLKVSLPPRVQRASPDVAPGEGVAQGADGRSCGADSGDKSLLRTVSGSVCGSKLVDMSPYLRVPANLQVGGHLQVSTRSWAISAKKYL